MDFFLHRSTAHPLKCYEDDYTHRLRAPNGCFCKKKKQTQTNPFFFPFLQSLVAVGAIFGCPIGGWAIDKFGRKRTLLLCSVPFELGWLLISFAQNRAMLYSGRISTGLACGIVSLATPVRFFFLSFFKYRKIPKISPSKYKPFKPVTQKTLG